MHHHLRPLVHFHECLYIADCNSCQVSMLHHSQSSMHRSLCTMHKSPFMASQAPFIPNQAPFAFYQQLLAFGCAGNGYLCSIRPSVYAQYYEESLPDSMTGADFLAKYHHHYDHATQVGIATLTLSSCTYDCPCDYECHLSDVRAIILGFEDGPWWVPEAVSRSSARSKDQ